MDQNILVYDLTITKIWCTMCANKIKQSFEGRSGIQYVQVNVMAERVIISFDVNLITLDQIRLIFEENNFHIVGSPRQVNADTNKQRKACFFFPLMDYNQKEIQSVAQNLKEEYRGAISEIQLETFNFQNKNGRMLRVTYHPLTIQGHQILKFLEDSFQLNTESNNEEQHLDEGGKVTVYDDVLQKFAKKEHTAEAVTLSMLLLGLGISCFYIVFSMILPQFDFYHSFMTYPNSGTVFSYYLIIMFLVTLFTMMYFGLSTYKNALNMFIHYRMFNMDTLLTLGSISAFIMSLLLLIVYVIQDRNYDQEQENENLMEQIMNITHDLESAGLILTIINIGKYFEGKAKQTILNMQNQIFPQDQLLRSPIIIRITVKNQDYDIDTEHLTEVSLLEKGDLIILKPGMKLLIDGVIVKGQVRAVDSVCYGWDDPFEATIGTRLKSGADILEGSCIFQIEQVLESSMLFSIAEQLNIAQSDREDKKFGISAVLQTLSQKFVLGVILISFLVLMIWVLLILFDSVEIDQYCVWCFPFERSISILVASCPCALGLAVPSVVVITLNLALKSGILIKKNTIFEQITKVKSVVFDKTGTLFTKIDHIESFTLLSSKLTEVYKQKNKQEETEKTVQKVKQYERQLVLSDPIETKRENTPKCCSTQEIKYDASLNIPDLWTIIGVMEKDFKHPLANLLFKESVKRQIGRQSTFVLTNQPELIATGIIGQVTRTTDKVNFNVLIGNTMHMDKNSVKMDEHYKEQCHYLEGRGKTILLMAVNEVAEVMLVLDNKTNLRPEAKAVVRALNEQLKLNCYILSGDSQKTVDNVGHYLGISENNLFGETDAQGKMKILKQLKENNQEVMMIGDGLNDILSLQQACIGVTINAKSELNLIASDVIALNENLWKIVALFKLMKLANRIIYINLGWAFAYNIFMAPIAAGAFYSVGFTVSPMISSAAMSLSSIIVVLISNLMRFIPFDPAEEKKKKIRVHIENSGSFSQYESYLAIESLNSSKKQSNSKKSDQQF